MSLVLKRNKRQYDIPDEGIINATLAEIKDLGEVQTTFGAKEKLLFVWEVDQTDQYGNRMKVFQRFTKSLHPQALLTEAIYSITGEDVGDELDLEDLIGINVQLLIKHNQGADGVIYANVRDIIRPKTKAEEVSEKRVQNVIDAHRRSLHRDQPGA